MKINRTCRITWEGVEHTINVNFRLIRKIHENDCNLMKMMELLGTGEADFSQVCIFVAVLLGEVGINVDPDDVWDGMMSENNEMMDPLELVNFLWEVVPVFFIRSKKNSTGKKNKPKK